MNRDKKMEKKRNNISGVEGPNHFPHIFFIYNNLFSLLPHLQPQRDHYYYLKSKFCTENINFTHSMCTKCVKVKRTIYCSQWGRFFAALFVVTHIISILFIEIHVYFRFSMLGKKNTVYIRTINVCVTLTSMLMPAIENIFTNGISLGVYSEKIPVGLCTISSNIYCLSLSISCSVHTPTSHFWYTATRTIRRPRYI